MFAVYCPTHRSKVLLGPRSVRRLQNTTLGVLLHWQCRCGTRGVVAFRHPSHDIPAAA